MFIPAPTEANMILSPFLNSWPFNSPLIKRSYNVGKVATELFPSQDIVIGIKNYFFQTLYWIIATNIIVIAKNHHAFLFCSQFMNPGHILNRNNIKVTTDTLTIIQSHIFNLFICFSNIFFTSFCNDLLSIPETE